MTSTIKAATAFHWSGHVYAPDDTVDTTGWSDHALRELFTNAPVYVAPAAASLDPDLNTIAALDSTQSGVIASDGSGWIRKGYTALKTSLGLAASDVSNTVSGLSVITHTNVQAALADLDAQTQLNKLNTQQSQRAQAFRPSAALAETWPRAFGTTVNPTALPTSGKLMMQGIYLPAGFVVSNFSFLTGTTAGASMTHWWMGLYDSSRVQLAMTADQTTAAIPASSTITVPVATVASGAASSFTTTYDGFYYVGLMVAATTLPNVYCAAPSLSSLAPITTGGSDTGQTTVPAFPHTANAITAGLIGLYVWLT